MRQIVRRRDVKTIEKLVAEGKTAEEISDQLQIAPEKIAPFVPKKKAKKKEAAHDDDVGDLDC